MRPSPVVVRSRQMMWPDVSPPRIPPLALQAWRAHGDRRPWRAGTRRPSSRSAISSPRLLMTVPDDGPAQLLRARAIARREIEELVAVDETAALVDHDDAIAVAVERHADVRAHAGDRELQEIRPRRAAAVVDVASVRRAPDRHDVGARGPTSRAARPCTPHRATRRRRS